MPTILQRYSDLDLFFNAHPVTGDITILKDAEAIKRSIRNLILTEFYERLYQPNLGSGIKQSLFENFNPLTAETIRSNVRKLIFNHEPRANLLNVTVEQQDDENTLKVSIAFEIQTVAETLNVDVFLTRVR